MRLILPFATALAACIFTAQQGHAADAPKASSQWREKQVQVSVDPTLEALGQYAIEGVLDATDAWSSASPSVPKLKVTYEKADEIGYFPGKSNKNTVRFARDGEPRAKGALAITVVTADATNGRILDADVIVNGAYKFGAVSAVDESASGKKPDATKADDKKKSSVTATVYDLQSVLTHEFGHVLGLKDDATNGVATMYVYSSPGEVNKRDLDVSDVSALQQLYGSSTSATVAEESEMATAAARGCVTALYGSPRGHWIAYVPVLLGLAFATRRRSSLRRGGVALLVGLAPLCAATAQAHTATTDAAPTDIVATAHVVQASSRWDNGFIVTDVKLSREGCRSADCSELPEELTLAGGRVGNLEQTVGHGHAPRVGARLELRMARAATMANAAERLSVTLVTQH
jgi:hypothetical protein